MCVLPKLLTLYQDLNKVVRKFAVMLNVAFRHQSKYATLSFVLESRLDPVPSSDFVLIILQILSFFRFIFFRYFSHLLVACLFHPSFLFLLFLNYTIFSFPVPSFLPSITPLSLSLSI